MILSEFDAAAILADPGYIATLYENEASTFAEQLGPANAAGDLTDPLLASAFAAICAYELKPYGNEIPGVVDLQGLLDEPSLACDDYVRLTMWLMQQMPECQSVDVAAVGWNGGAIGDHAELFVSDGNESILLDPTIGLVARYASFDTLVSGIPTTDFASFFEAPSPDPWQLTQFNREVVDALQNGLYRPTDMYYYYTSLADLNASGATLTQAEAAFCQTLIKSGALPSQTPFESVLSFISNNADLFGSAASAIAEEPAIQNEATTISSVQQDPLTFSLGAGQNFMAQAVANEAAGIEMAFGIGAADAGLLGAVLVLGGLAAAYDGNTGASTLQDIENSLTPDAFQALVASITASS
jgi:hypothetical protein